ncbi:MAG: SAM-dependent chlorinase/fluorinase [Thioalkalispiraceae bacterium]|jgi:hypothetical protein
MAIYLFTDFSYQGPYVGELKQVIAQSKFDDQTVIDLMHDAPVYNPRASAYLLAALSERFQVGDACLGVVDPGVGSESRAPILLKADGILYCGPDNGLFSQIAMRASQIEINEIVWRPNKLSSSFHGRDLFAPALQKALRNEIIKVRPRSLNELAGSDWPINLPEVIYIDGFGNLVTGHTAKSIAQEQSVIIAEKQLSYADTFSAKQAGEPFWYINSMGLVEIAVNQGRADEYFQANIGTRLSVAG